MICARTPMSRRIAFSSRAGASLVLVLLGIAALASGCGSDSNDDKTPASGGSGTGGRGAAGSGVAGSSGGATITPGQYGACTNDAPASTAPDLTGRWAIRTVASRYVPATGLTAAFYTRTISV